MQTDVYIKIINEKMNMEFWMAGFLVIPKVYAVIASPFRRLLNCFVFYTFVFKTKQLSCLIAIQLPYAPGVYLLIG